MILFLKSHCNQVKDFVDLPISVRRVWWPLEPEVLVRPACDVSETTNKCFMAQNLWLTCFNQVVWTVLRGFVEELDLLEPECEIDLRNARLSNILHACGPVHVFVVVFPCRLSRAVHVGETIRESGIARPGCVRV